MRQLIVILTLIFLTTKSVRATEKIKFDYIAYPNVVVVNSEEMVMDICLVNKGGNENIINDGISNNDYIKISITLGDSVGNLATSPHPAVTCQSPGYPDESSWICESDFDESSYIDLIIKPNGEIFIEKGSTYCFKINALFVNSIVGLASLSVSQDIASNRADAPGNTDINIYKVDSSTPIEIDPTVDTSVKDGVSWAEIINIPTDFLDGIDDIGATDWDQITNKPTGFGDNIDDVGITEETDPTITDPSIKDGITWSEIAARPSGLDDGDDVGITEETDPKVASSNLNVFPKYNGSNLVDSFTSEDASGNVSFMGDIKLGSGSLECINSAHAGAVRYNVDCLEVCDGTKWKNLCNTSSSTNSTLSINTAGTGSGEVDNGAGIICYSDCLVDYEEGDIVTLTAVSDADSKFIGWAGGGCSGTEVCTLTMNSSINVTATFERLEAKALMLIHSNDVDESIVFTDSSTITPHDIIREGDVRHSTGEAIIGMSSILFDGYRDYLKIIGSESWDFGYEDYTIDFWIKCGPQTSDSQNNTMVLSRFETISTYADFGIQVRGTGVIRLIVDNGSDNDYLVNLSGETIITDNNWHHVAIVRDNNTTKIYINGLLDATSNTVYNANVAVGQPLTLGLSPALMDQGYDLDFHGYLDEIRIVKGQAAWTTNFTPPTTPYSE